MRASIALRHHAAVIEQERQYAEGLEDAGRVITQEIEYPHLLQHVLGYKEHFPSDQIYPRPSLKLLGSLFEQICWLDTDEPERQKMRPQQLSVARELLLPMSGIRIESHAATAQVLRGTRFSACRDAEDFFVKTLKQANTGRYQGHALISVYHNSSGQPLLLRKKDDVSSALTLEPLNLEGLPIPTGTIIGLSRRERRPPTAVRQKRGYKLAAYPMDARLKLGPVRLSPWAYETAIDRSSFAVNNIRDVRSEEVTELYYDPYRGRMVERYSIDDFRAAAQRVLTACGIS